MTSYTRRETAEFMNITGSDDFSSRTPVLRLGIALPGVKHELPASARPHRKRKEGAVAGWVILILVITVTGTYWRQINCAERWLKECRRCSGSATSNK